MVSVLDSMLSASILKNSVLKKFPQILCYCSFSVAKDLGSASSVLFINSVLKCQFREFLRDADNTENSRPYRYSSLKACRAWNFSMSIPDFVKAKSGIDMGNSIC